MSIYPLEDKFNSTMRFSCILFIGISEAEFLLREVRIHERGECSRCGLVKFGLSGLGFLRCGFPCEKIF